MFLLMIMQNFFYLQDIAQLELFCTQLYQSPDQVVRTEAEKALILFSNSPDCLQKCQFLLERGTVSAVLVQLI